MKSYGTCGLACIFLLLTAGVQANPVTIDANIGWRPILFNFAEYDDSNERLLTESGRLSLGVFANIGIQKDHDQGVIGVEYGSGDTNYHGRTNAGVPLATSAGEQLFRVFLKAGRHFDGFSGIRWSFFAGVDRFYWWRSIYSQGRVSGLDETYRAWDVFAEMRCLKPIRSWLSTELVLRISKSVTPQVVVDIPNRDQITLDLGTRLGYRLSAPVRFHLNEYSSLMIEPFYDVRYFGRSATQMLYRSGQITGSVYEPRSQLVQRGLAIGFEYKF